MFRPVPERLGGTPRRSQKFFIWSGCSAAPWMDRLAHPLHSLPVPWRSGRAECPVGRSMVFISCGCEGSYASDPYVRFASCRSMQHRQYLLPQQGAIRRPIYAGDKQHLGNPRKSRCRYCLGRKTAQSQQGAPVHAKRTWRVRLTQTRRSSEVYTSQMGDRFAVRKLARATLLGCAAAKDQSRHQRPHSEGETHR